MTHPTTGQSEAGRSTPAAGGSGPLVSVLIAVQDQAALLATCLQSLAKTLPPALEFEVVVVDNASVDATGQVLDMVKGDIRVMRHATPVPPCHALDEALAGSAATYIWLADVARPPLGTALQPLVRALQGVHSLAAAVPATAGDPANASHILVRTDALRRIGGFRAADDPSVRAMIAALKAADLPVAAVDMAVPAGSDGLTVATHRTSSIAPSLADGRSPQPVHACTIIARNYLPQARVLATSFQSHHPGGKLTVLVVEDGHEEEDGQEPFEILRVKDLVGDGADLRRMAALYDLLEYSTALKPWLLKTLLDRGAPTAIYLDPDIQVFDSLDEVVRLAAVHEIVLTPHVTAPIPRDGKTVTESSILGAGIFNLGFAAVGPRSDRALDFWIERLRRECLVKPEEMRFVDQRWMDFAPGIFDVAVVRDPGYNVAYWNLDHRDVRRMGAGYVVTGRPLRFFHFSGYSPRTRHLLSKHQIEPARILLSEHPVVRQLCDGYGDLLEAHGFGADDSGAPYQFSYMANGIPMDKYVRRLYRELVAAADAGRDGYPPDPFERQGAEDFCAWLRSPATIPGNVEQLTWYLAAVYAEHPKVRLAFRNPQGADRDAFLKWAHQEAAEGRLERRLLPGLSDAERPSHDHPIAVAWARPDELRPGCAVVGYMKAELGIGEWGRLTAQAIDKAKIPSATVVTTSTLSRQQHPFMAKAVSRYDFDTNVICANADQLPHLCRELGTDWLLGRYNIAQWAWELEEFPDCWNSSFQLIDEIWAISDFARTAIAAATDKPVFTCPPAIVAPSPPAEVDRSALGLPTDRYVFLFTFDLLSILERKNPIGLIDAFRSAFPTPRRSGPLLVLKVINGHHRPTDLERIRVAVDGREDILVIDRYLSAPLQAGLMAAADCYVSLHRSEGFGLTMGESMALGKPVIATGYSGNLDFMTGDTSYLVKWSPGSVPPGCDPYRPGAQWAEPDLDDAARLLAHVFDHPAEAAEVGARARRMVLQHHGLAARAAIVRSRFDAIQASRAEQRHRAPSVGPTGTASSPRADEVPRPMATDPVAVDRISLLEHRLDTVERLMVASDQRATDRDAARQADIARLHVASRDLREAMEGGMATLAKGSTSLQEQIDDVRRTVGSLQVVPYMSDPTGLLVEDELGRPVIGYRLAGSTSSGTYADFEEIFRGSEDLVRERQRVYLPLLTDRSPVLDVGCGRGEMLDLLSACGVRATGLDLDESMVARCRAKGHTVDLVDALAHLDSLESDSVGAIFSAQVIEHLRHEDLTRFLSSAYRALQPSGVLIVETVNPHALHAFKTFWTDLSHMAPIFPEVAVVLCRSAGFEEASVLFPAGTGELERDRWHEGEYAVIARKAASGHLR